MPQFLLLVAACALLWGSPAEAQGKRGSEPLVGAAGGAGEVVGRFRALLIAINDYEHWTPLSAPRKDVDALADVLRRRYLFEDSDVRVLYDIDGDALDDALRTLARSAGADDSVLVYFAGHGHQDKLTKTGYWVPRDGRENKPRDYLSGEQIRGILAASRAKHVALISDSCFSGALIRTQRAGRQIDDSYYARMYAKRSFEVLTSGSNEPVADAGAEGHSPFAYYLIRKLEDPGQPYLDLTDVFQAVRKNVQNYSNQVPLFGKLQRTPGEGGGFVLVARGAAGLARPVASRPDPSRPDSSRGSAPTATAKPGPPPRTDLRFAIALKACIGDAKTTTDGAQSALAEALIGAGASLVDETHARKLRSIDEAGRLVGGKVAEVLTAIDADAAVAGRCRLQRIKNDLLGDGAFSVQAVAEARVFRVDTAEVVGSFTVTGGGLGYSEAQAAQAAAAKAGRTLGDKVLRAIAVVESSKRIEVHVTGLPNVGATDRVLSALRGLPGVATARTLHAGRAVSKFQLETGGAGARELAVALDGSEAGLSVFGYSNRTIKAEYSAVAALSLELLRGRFRARGKGGAGAPGGDETATSIETALLGTGLVRMVGRRKKPGNTTLVLEGKVERNRRRFHASMTLRIGGTGDVLLADQTRGCLAGQEMDCVVAMSRRVASVLGGALEAKRHLFGGGRLPKGPAMTETRPLEVLEVRLDPIAGEPNAGGLTHVGTILLRNTANSPLTGVSLSSWLPGYSTREHRAALPDLPAGKRKAALIELRLSGDVLEAVRKPTAAALELTVEYVVDGLTVRQQVSRAARITPKNP